MNAEQVTLNPPAIGQTMYVRGHVCRIVRVLDAGTLDVVSLCGEFSFRVSGLLFAELEAPALPEPVTYRRTTTVGPFRVSHRDTLAS